MYRHVAILPENLNVRVKLQCVSLGMLLKYLNPLYHVTAKGKQLRFKIKKGEHE